MNLRYLLLSMVMTATIAVQAQAQDLSVYRWENRLVLLLAKDDQSARLGKQLELLNQDSTGLAERKLMVISATPTQVKRVFPNPWSTAEASGSIYRQFHRKGKFELVLMGLDGGVKLRRSAPMELKELYRIIDSMPMRAAEMRRKNN